MMKRFGNNNLDLFNLMKEDECKKLRSKHMTTNKPNKLFTRKDIAIPTIANKNE